jgi:hypothetical protein
MKLVKVAVFAAFLFAPLTALAQQSEFQAKMQEYLDGYKDRIKTNCKLDVPIKWAGGKFASDPNQPEKEGYNALTTLAPSALEGLDTACRSNAAVVKALGGVKSIEITQGKGTIGYKLGGGKITFTVDGSFTKNNPAGQESDLVEKLKKDLDK